MAANLHPITYCMNVHDASSWSAIRRSLDESVLPIKRQVAPDALFPLSLHLSHAALQELSAPQATRAFRAWLAEHHCVWPAINAFPHDTFQGLPVKQNVYRPNWSHPARLDYTRQAMTLLAAFLPDGMTGTITTVPGGWHADWTSPRDDTLARQHLADLARHGRQILEQTGKFIQVAIEPEPGCVWKLNVLDLDEFAPHLTWCLDTCHAAVDFESIDALDWRRISRVQFSAALECDNTPDARDALRAFVEPHYLHQTRAALDGQIIASWDDLPPALEALPQLPASAVVRVHYHVPLTWEGAGPLRTTRHNLTPALFERTRRVFCEIETYTYSVLPPALRNRPLETAIAAELQWAAARL